MNNPLNNKHGFTIIEVLVSLGIMLVFLPFAAGMLVNSQLLASYSKHKIQAAYAAQQIIETQRQNISTYFVAPIGPLQSGKSYIFSGNVMLDTKGNYSIINTTCSSSNIPCGSASVTVTPSVYTNSSGTQVTSTSTDHFVVAIKWTEQILNLQVPITETYAEDIANDTMLN